MDELDDSSTDEDKVCVFGGYAAWPFYQRNAAYVCQPRRHYRPDTGRIGFYSQRTIYGAAPLVLARYPQVSLDADTVAGYTFSVDPMKRHLGLAMAAAMEDEGREDWDVQVLLLSAISDPRTARFEPVHHDGRGAWTQRQRYTRVSALKVAQTTDDLLDVSEEF